jgi:hypothetical protein
MAAQIDNIQVSLENKWDLPDGVARSLIVGTCVLKAPKNAKKAKFVKGAAEWREYKNILR